MVAGLRTLEPGLDLILTSPLVRARQTAEILSQRSVADAATRACRGARAGPSRRPRWPRRSEPHTQPRAVVALVGHEPDLGSSAAWLIGAQEPLSFKKGGIARIDVHALPPGQDGQLVWLATPRCCAAWRSR